MNKVSDSLQYCKSQYELSRQEERNIMFRKKCAEDTTKNMRKVIDLLMVLDEIITIVNDQAIDKETAYEEIKKLLG